MIVTLAGAEREELSRIAGADPPLVVIALCAAWCNTCAEFRSAFDSIATRRPEVVWVWMDVEDDAELCGDIDVQNFPTIVAFRGERILHYGVTAPLGGVVARLVEELATRSRDAHDIPEPVIALRDGLLALARDT